MLERESPICLISTRLVSEKSSQYGIVQGDDLMDITQDAADAPDAAGEWYYVVGTSISSPLSAGNVVMDEDKEGRILLFRFSVPAGGGGTAVTVGSLALVSSVTVPGSVHDMAFMESEGGRIIAGINNSVHAFKWDSVTQKLASSVSYGGLTACLNVNVTGSSIAVGDLMNSVTVLSLRCLDDGQDDLVQDAVDKSTIWMAGFERIDDMLVCADSSLNLFTLERETEPVAGDLVGRLTITGRYHLGDCVNRFRKGMIGTSIIVYPHRAVPTGSLAMSISAENDSIATPRLLFGTVHGHVGVVATLKSNSDLLEQVQSRMRSIVKQVGDFDHEEYVV